MRIQRKSKRSASELRQRHGEPPVDRFAAVAADDDAERAWSCMSCGVAIRMADAVRREVSDPGATPRYARRRSGLSNTVAACLRRRCGLLRAGTRERRFRAPSRRSARPAAPRCPRRCTSRIARNIACTIDRRQAERRLVEQQQARLRHQRAADRDHLLLSARQRARRRVELVAHRREQRADVVQRAAALACAPRADSCRSRGSRARSSA